MSTTSIRGKERTLRVNVEGEDQPGFVDVTEFSEEPMDEIVQEDIVGEKASRFDHSHDGYTITFSTHTRDRAGHDYLARLVARYEASTVAPRVTIRVKTIYRDGAPSTMMLYSEGVLRMVNVRNSARKDFILAQWEFKCSRRQAIG